MGNSIGTIRVYTVCFPSFNGILNINGVLRFMNIRIGLNNNRLRSCLVAGSSGISLVCKTAVTLDHVIQICWISKHLKAGDHRLASETPF